VLKKVYPKGHQIFRQDQIENLPLSRLTKFYIGYKNSFKEIFISIPKFTEEGRALLAHSGLRPYVRVDMICLLLLMLIASVRAENVAQSSSSVALRGGFEESPSH
jgi:hypothetical protein